MRVIDCEYDSNSEPFRVTCDDDGDVYEFEIVRHGRWNHDGPRFKGGVDWYSCSECGNSNAAEWMKYCCMCGARMDGGNENG